MINLEHLSLKCPHCGEHTLINQWITMAITTTSCSATFSFGARPKNSDGMMCPWCRAECSYDEIIKAMQV